MTETKRVVFALVLAGVLALEGGARAQEPPAPPPQPPPESAGPPPRAEAPPPQAPQPPARRAPQPARPPEPPETPPAPAGRNLGEIFRLGQDYTLPAGDTASEVVVIFGNATINGHVDGDAVVIAGAGTLGGTAVVDGDLVVIGGNLSVMPGAVANRELVVIGGTLDAPPGFAPGGENVTIGPNIVGTEFQALADWFNAVVPWVTRGFFYGRPIVPDLPWVWAVVGVVFFVYLVLNLIFDHAIGVCAVQLADRPMTSFLTGLLVLLLAGPVCFILLVSVIGLIIVPFLICGLLIAGLIGRIAVARCLGMQVLRGEAGASRLHSLLTFVIGFALITVAYIIPVLGFLTWLLVGVFGLGAVTLAFAAAFRRENPPRPAPPPGAPIPPPLSAFAQEGAAPGTAGAEAAATAGGASAAFAAEPGAAASQAWTPPAPAASTLVALPRATFMERLGAFALDAVLIAIVVALLVPDPTFVLLFLVYRIGFWAWKGTTVGGIICQLRLVRVDGAPLGFADALVRGLASIFSIIVLGLGCFWVLRDPERQAWHDKIAGTYVVKVPRNWPI
jgi:uncharacterized RDD family membrane protein YckC